MRRTIAAVAAFALLTTGCATYSWYRADTPPDVVARDQAECYDLARASKVDVPFSAFPGSAGIGNLTFTGPSATLAWFCQR